MSTPEKSTAAIRFDEFVVNSLYHISPYNINGPTTQEGLSSGRWGLQERIICAHEVEEFGLQKDFSSFRSAKALD